MVNTPASANTDGSNTGRWTDQSSSKGYSNNEYQQQAHSNSSKGSSKGTKGVNNKSDQGSSSKGTKGANNNQHHNYDHQYLNSIAENSQYNNTNDKGNYKDFNSKGSEFELSSKSSKGNGKENTTRNKDSFTKRNDQENAPKESPSSTSAAGKRKHEKKRLKRLEMEQTELELSSNTGHRLSVGTARSSITSSKVTVTSSKATPTPKLHRNLKHGQNPHEAQAVLDNTIIGTASLNQTKLPSAILSGCCFGLRDFGISANCGSLNIAKISRFTHLKQHFSLQNYKNTF